MISVKAEFDADASNLGDFNRLIRIINELNIELHVKIGGVETYRYLYDRIEMNVDGIIAPMVETSFGAIKFREMLNKIHFYVKTLPEITNKIETRSSVKEIKKIPQILNMI